MLASPRTRLAGAAVRVARSASQQQRRWTSEDSKSLANTAPSNKPAVPNVSSTNATPTSSFGSSDKWLQELPEDAEKFRVAQAPNRQGIWAQSQNPREKAMTGPRFEQTIMELQPRPMAAIELIHKQPVRWSKKRQVSCDGGGGPLGHPRIFINLDKPQVCWCTYCGVPYANEHHRKHLESLPSTPYPLEPTGDAAEVPESQSHTGKPLEQR